MVIVDDFRKESENSGAILPGRPGDEIPSRPRWPPIEDQLAEMAEKARERWLIVLSRAAVVAVPTLLTHLLLIWLSRTSIAWWKENFTGTETDVAHGLAVIVVNSTAIVVLGGLLAPVLKGVAPTGRWFGMLLRLCGLTFFLGVFGLALCAFTLVFHNSNDSSLWASVKPWVLFYIVGFLAVSAIEIRFAFAAPGVTLEGLTGRAAFGRSRKLTRGVFFRILGIRLMSRVLLESFGGVAGTAVTVLLLQAANVGDADQGLPYWTLMAVVKWVVLTPMLALTSMLAVIQFLNQADYFRAQEGISG